MVAKCHKPSIGKLPLFLQRLYHLIRMLICTTKSGFNVPDNQFINQVLVKSQTTVAVVVAVLNILV